ncbi:hypothetical protein ACRTDU_04015 [Sunxiuqinia elliptica]
MNIQDWRKSNEYSHYQSLIKQDIENRKRIQLLIVENTELKRKQANGVDKAGSMEEFAKQKLLSKAIAIKANGQYYAGMRNNRIVRKTGLHEAKLFFAFPNGHIEDTERFLKKRRYKTNRVIIAEIPTEQIHRQITLDEAIQREKQLQ